MMDQRTASTLLASFERGTYALRWRPEGQHVPRYDFWEHSAPNMDRPAGEAARPSNAARFTAYLNGESFTFADEAELARTCPALVVLDAARLERITEQRLSPLIAISGHRKTARAPRQGHGGKGY